VLKGNNQELKHVPETGGLFASKCPDLGYVPAFSNDHLRFSFSQIYIKPFQCLAGYLGNKKIKTT